MFLSLISLINILTTTKAIRYITHTTSHTERTITLTWKHRSPNYPGIDLEDAIDSVVKLYNSMGRNEFDSDDAITAWGYSSGSGPVRVRMAALRQFGLLDGRRGESRRVSRTGLVFATRDQSSPEYQEALRATAVRPPLFAKARDTMPNASDNALRQWLLMDEDFSDEGASRFVEVFRSTMRFAGLDNIGITSGLEDNAPWNASEDARISSSRTDSHHRHHAPPRTPETSRPAHTRVPLRLMGGSQTVTIELPDSMTETAWQQMMSMLNALKAGYVPTENDGPNLAPGTAPIIDTKEAANGPTEDLTQATPQPSLDDATDDNS